MISNFNLILHARRAGVCRCVYVCVSVYVCLATTKQRRKKIVEKNAASANNKMRQMLYDDAIVEPSSLCTTCVCVGMCVRESVHVCVCVCNATAQSCVVNLL